MKITHREPIAFNVACIKPKQFFKTGFLKNRVFWKLAFLEIQHFEKPLHILLFCPPVF